jgi:hypothetical protein
MCTKECHYNVIKRVCRKMDIQLSVDENSDWDLWWSDTGVSQDTIKKVKAH